MRVMEIRDSWGTASIVAVERPDRDPGPREVAVKMEAASINYRDLVMARGGYGRRGGSLPLVPVSDGAGRVVAVGSDVDQVAVGDLVCPLFAQTWLDGPLLESHWAGMLGGPLDGVMQECMVLPQQGVARVPEHLSAVEAATLPCAALTAWNAVIEVGAVGPGDTVVTQGTGGVSLFALQFAKLMGARVIATSSSDTKLTLARSLGADETINYRQTPEWGRLVREMTGGRGADVVVEVGGAGTLEQSIRAVRVSGKVCLIGVLSGAAGPLNLGPVVTQHISLLGITVGSRAMFEAMCRAVAQHQLQPVFELAPGGFDQVAAAIESIGEGRHIGKLCLRF